MASGMLVQLNSLGINRKCVVLFDWEGKRPLEMEHPEYSFDGVEDMPRDEWISMRQGFRLPGSPSDGSVYNYRTKGALRPDGTRVFLPTFRANGKNYTTVAAYKWYLRQQRGK